MSGPRLVRELLAAWPRGVPVDEARGLQQLLESIGYALGVARAAPATLDRRCMELCQQRLEEAEHWALAAMLDAVKRSDHECPPSV